MCAVKRDDGYITVVAAALMLVIGIIAAFALVVADVVATRQAAASAADLAALSAASHLLAGGSVSDACARAQQSAQVQRAAVVSCDVAGTDVVVGVSSTPSNYTRRLLMALSNSADGSVHATARAGAPMG